MIAGACARCAPGSILVLTGDPGPLAGPTRESVMIAVRAVRFCRSLLAATLGLSNMPAAISAETISSADIVKIFSQFSSPATPGCAVGVFERGRSLFTGGFGAADIATDERLTDNTLFYAASTSKQFTALALAKAIEEGKVKLTDDVRRYVPELPGYGTPMTVSMLLYHTAGLRDYLDLFTLAGVPIRDELSIPATLAMIVRQRGLNFTPGTRHDYTNSGYFLLAEIVARASGMPFHEWVRARILSPLGMSSSYVRHGPNPPQVKVARGYGAAPAGYVLRDSYPPFGGSGGLMTSIADMQRFDRDFHVGHKVWTRSTRRLLLTPGTLSNGEPIPLTDQLSYAGGVHVGKRRGVDWVAHGGSAAGFRSEYLRLPEKKLGIAVLCNRSDVFPWSLAEKVLDASRGIGLTGEWSPPRQFPANPVDAASTALTPEIAGALAGRYRSEELAADYVFAPGARGLQVSAVSSYQAASRAEPLCESVRMLSGELIRCAGYTFKLRRAAGEGIQGFTVHGSRMQGIAFVRND